MRTGVITQKVGMTRLFLADGTHVPVTVLKLDGCAVVAIRNQEKDGYSAVQLGSGFAKPKNTPKAERGHFAKAEIEPRKKVAEFRVDAGNLLEVGDLLQADHFVAGQKVDVERGLIMNRGAVPGSKGGWVMVRDAVKRPHKGVPMPASVKKRASAAPAAEEPKAEA